jgi:hypothetical protein
VFKYASLSIKIVNYNKKKFFKFLKFSRWTRFKRKGKIGGIENLTVAPTKVS